MTVVLDIPAEIERALHGRAEDIGREAKQAMLVDFYRRGLLSHAELAAALGLSRYEIDGLLKRHGVAEDLIGVEEFRAEITAANRKLEA